MQPRTLVHAVRWTHACACWLFVSGDSVAVDSDMTHGDVRTLCLGGPSCPPKKESDGVINLLNTLCCVLTAFCESICVCISRGNNEFGTICCSRVVFFNGQFIEIIYFFSFGDSALRKETFKMFHPRWLDVHILVCPQAVLNLICVDTYRILTSNVSTKKVYLCFHDAPFRVTGSSSRQLVPAALLFPAALPEPPR